MPTLRTSLIPVAFAERVVQYSWLTLERYRLPTPRLAIHQQSIGREGRLLTLELTFRSELSFPIFVERLRQRFPACKFVVVGASSHGTSVGSRMLAAPARGRHHQGAG